VVGLGAVVGARVGVGEKSISGMGETTGTTAAEGCCAEQALTRIITNNESPMRETSFEYVRGYPFILMVLAQ
jgi:hypothetical protein